MSIHMNSLASTTNTVFTPPQNQQPQLAAILQSSGSMAWQHSQCIIELFSYVQHWNSPCSQLDDHNFISYDGQVTFNLKEVAETIKWLPCLYASSYENRNDNKLNNINNNDNR